jgi:glycine betaine/proline transport system substrate-binding protein
MKTTAIALTCILCALPTFANIIKITYTDWPEGVVLSHLAAAVLEEKMGHQVELKLAETEAIFDSVAAGEQDVYLNAWLPFTQASYWKKHSFELERLGTVIEKTRLGLAVPAYVNVTNINQLNENRALFGGNIIGIELDSGTTKITNAAIEEYKLNFTQLHVGTTEMAVELGKAIAAKKPILITGWTPHWIFARYDLKMLIDTRNVYQPDGIRKFARPGFGKDLPEADRFLKRFAITENQLNALLLEVHHGRSSPEAITRSWMLAHPEIVKAWIAPEKKWWQKII